ncbi:uncharacterized protein LOC116609936 [Nematostella vectensis]|uniref:uncharacterized protein LOC116609936 n=1 Tax=Nematostella vectensis TaxID=45351 RepID=UPI00207794AC|nr:uncharacterized protein LOC116609936 [Nematostella vectensis]
MADLAYLVVFLVLFVHTVAHEFVTMSGVTEEDKALDLPPSLSLIVAGLIACSARCRRQDFCLYYNYRAKDDDQALGLCEIFDVFLSRKDLSACVKSKPGSLFVAVPLAKSDPRSCVDYARVGLTHLPKFYIVDDAGDAYRVTCDFTSEPGSLWTLVKSDATPPPQYFTTALYVNAPKNQDNPNWSQYRLSLPRMEALQNVSTHWRVTCSFPRAGVDYTDYLRGNFSSADPVHVFGPLFEPACREVEFLNIRGFTRKHIMEPLFQHDGFFEFCIESASAGCGGKWQAVPNAVFSEDNFGLYGFSNINFRCTNQQDSSTNMWFGSYL